MTEKFIDKECKKHGTTTFVLSISKDRKRYTCKICRVEKVTRNRQNRKAKLVEYFGGKCTICGYNRCQQSLQFHHINPKEKEFTISSKGVCRSWDRMLEEAKKCIMVCANCHFEIENNIINVDMGR